MRLSFDSSILSLNFDQNLKFLYIIKLIAEIIIKALCQNFFIYFFICACLLIFFDFLQQFFYRLGRSVLKNILSRSQKRPSTFGLGPFLRPRQNIFPVRTSQPVNNIYIFPVTSTCPATSTNFQLPKHYPISKT